MTTRIAHPERHLIILIQIGKRTPVDGECETLIHRRRLIGQVVAQELDTIAKIDAHGMLNLRPVREHHTGWNLVMDQLHAEERLRQHALRLRVQDRRDKPIGVYDIILPEDDPGARFADQRTIQVVGDVVAKHPLGVERDQVRQTHLGREAIIILIDRKHVSRHEHRWLTALSLRLDGARHRAKVVFAESRIEIQVVVGHQSHRQHKDTDAACQHERQIVTARHWRRA